MEAATTQLNVSLTTEVDVPPAESPLKRSIGLAGAIRFVVAVAAMYSTGAAFMSGRYGLAVVALVFFIGAAVLGFRARRPQ